MLNPGQITTVDIEVRHYELDAQRHVNHAVYLMYGEHARFRHCASLGIGFAKLALHGVGFVLLEQTVKYLRELREGDTLTVTCELTFPDAGGKTFRFDHHLHRADGVPVADISCVAGLLDLDSRRLVDNPQGVLAAFAATDAPGR